MTDGRYTIPPYSPRRRKSLSHPTTAVTEQQSNNSVPPLFYTHHSQGSHHSLSGNTPRSGSGPGVPSVAPLNTVPYSDAEPDRAPVPVPVPAVRPAFADCPTQFFQLVPFYIDETETGSSMALVPVSRENLRRSLDGGRGGRPTSWAPSRARYRSPPRGSSVRMDAAAPRNARPGPHGPQTPDFENWRLPKRPSLLRRIGSKLRRLFGGGHHKTDEYDSDNYTYYRDEEFEPSFEPSFEPKYHAKGGAEYQHVNSVPRDRPRYTMYKPFPEET